MRHLAMILYSRQQSAMCSLVHRGGNRNNGNQCGRGYIVSNIMLKKYEARNIDDVARLMPFVGAQDRSRTCTPLDTRT